MSIQISDVYMGLYRGGFFGILVHFKFSIVQVFERQGGDDCKDLKMGGV